MCVYMCICMCMCYVSYLRGGHAGASVEGVAVGEVDSRAACIVCIGVFSAVSQYNCVYYCDTCVYYCMCIYMLHTYLLRASQ
jgi:hypothetical protein